MPFIIFYTQIKQVHQDKPTSLHPTPSCFFIPIISFTSSLPFAGAAYKVNEVIHFSFTAPSLFRSFLKIGLLVIQTFRNRKIKNNDSFKKVRFTLKKVKLTFSKVNRVFRKISFSFLFRQALIQQLKNQHSEASYKGFTAPLTKADPSHFSIRKKAEPG